jgi:hypothetical protein
VGGRWASVTRGWGVGGGLLVGGAGGAVGSEEVRRTRETREREREREREEWV